ncbi:hypothetical protein B0H19DRAFT_1188047 [Mycena capillaripes]|nr:hypothetical protein B0H19DRAFT_1188047 [Mycena capillaripes]
MRRLSRRFPGVRRRTVPVPPLSSSFDQALPMELWELVFGQLSDNNLLLAARVCCAWNDRCITIRLLRSDISQPSLNTGTLSLHSDLLVALQLSRLTPRLHTLSCAFRGSWVLRDLKCLHAFIARSRSLQILELSFDSDLFTLQYHHHRSSRSAVLTHVCDIVRAMAQKTTGVIAVLAESYLYIVHSADLAEWRPRRTMHRVQFVIFALLVGRQGWRQKFIQLPRLLALEMRAVEPEKPSRFTLLTFDVGTMHSIHLGGSHDDDPWVTARQFSAVLPHISLPFLHTVGISIALEPAPFTQFLRNHPRIRTIELMTGHSQSRALPMLTTHAVTHAGLTHFKCAEPQALIPLLNTFHLSPKLRAISLSFTRSTPSDVLEFKYAVRRLSLHCPPLRLELDAGWTAHGKQFDAEDRLIASCLYCVETLYIISGSTATTKSLLGWAACLPDLRSLELYCPNVEMPSFLEEMRARLPWVADIQLRAE